MSKTYTINESATLTELTGSRYRMRIMEGDKLGATGFYPAEVVRRDGPKIFKAGTPMYLDHQTEAESQHKPFGSVTTYAAEFVSDAEYVEGDGLYADIEVFEHQRPLIKSLWNKIGVSIRATGNAVLDVIEGKKVPVFTSLDKARSVDFVTRAGAGGMLVNILESQAEESEEEDNKDMELKEISDKLDALALVVEKIQPVPAVESAVETVEVVDLEKSLEVAEALAASNLTEAGRKRVVAALKADSEAEVSALITAEEAYVAEIAESANNNDEEFELGAEEGANRENGHKPVELKLPRTWSIKD